MSRMRTFQRNLDPDSINKAKEVGILVERSLNAMRIPKGRRNNNHQVRALRKVMDRRRRES